MKLGYNTNGLQCHRWPQALELLAETGYRAVGLTLDHHCLDPYAANFGAERRLMEFELQRRRLTCVIETGARFLLNPRVKHEPTLLSPTAEEREVRIEFLQRAIDTAAALDAEVVSLWSGVLREPISVRAACQRLAEGLAQVLDYAGEHGITLAFEPEPGMFVDTFAQFERLLDTLQRDDLQLTIDIGHVHCIEPEPIPALLRAWASRLRNVHIEDMRRGIHEHLRFGDGEIQFGPVLQTLREIGYTGCVTVELSRHGHQAPEVLRESFEFLQRHLAPP